MLRMLVVVAVVGCSNKSASNAPPAGSGSAPAPAAPVKLKPACDLLTADEVGKIAGTSVTVDPAQSGPDSQDEQHCAFMHDRDTVLILSEHDKVSFESEQVDAFGATNPPVKIDGLGDAALYAEFKNGYGSNLLVKRGPVTLVFGGNQRRDAYVAMAKLALSRM